MGSTGRILIADPDARALSLTASGLRKAGFEVVSTSRGEEALALLQGEPSLILCEASLEGVDGFALCESARKSPATRDIPFLLLARKEENVSRERAKTTGADDFLTKPLYVRDVTTLAQLFAGRRADTVTLEGELSVTPLFYVLRALTSGGRSGVIELPAEQGMIHFREGRLVEASTGTIQGEAAVNRLMVLSQGTFTLRLVPVLLRGSISYSLRDLVSFDEPRRQRFEKAVAAMGGQEAHLVVDIPTLARELPKLPASIERIARLFDGQRTLGDVLRACDLDEVTAAETVLRLFALRIIQASADRFVLPHDAPHLFEPRNDEAILAMRELFPEPADPLLAQVLPEAPREVRDWFSELGQRSSFQELLSVGTGGWMEVPVESAGEKVREAAGPISDEEVESRLAELDDGKQKERPAEPIAEASAAAPSPALASAEASAPKAPATEAPAPAAAAPAPSAVAPSASSAPEAQSAPADAHEPQPVPVTTFPPPPAPARPEEIALAEHLLERIAAAEHAQPPAASQEKAPEADQLTKEEEELVRSGPVRPLAIVVVCAVVAAGALFLFMPRKKSPPPANPPTPAAAVAKVAKVEAPPSPAPAAPAPSPVAQPAPANEPVAAEPAAGEAPPAPANEPAVAANQAPSAAPSVAPLVPPAPKEPAKADAPSESFKALLAQGKALYEKGRAQAALGPLEKAAALAPDNCDAQVLLALARLDAGKLGPAETAARRALELDASNARAHLVLGTVYQEHSQNKAARAEYEAYLKLAPSGEYASDVKAILAELH